MTFVDGEAKYRNDDREQTVFFTDDFHLHRRRTFADRDVICFRAG